MDSEVWDEEKQRRLEEIRKELYDSWRRGEEAFGRWFMSLDDADMWRYIHEYD